MLYDRPSAAARARRSRAKLVPHSHRRSPTYPDPATGRTWPPRGWSEAGIRNHEVAHKRAMSFLTTFGVAGSTTAADYPKIPVTEARIRELAQFGRDRDAAAAVLEEATTSVLDLRGFARADTHPIQRPRHHGLYQPGAPRPPQHRSDQPRRSGAAS